MRQERLGSTVRKRCKHYFYMQFVVVEYLFCYVRWDEVKKRIESTKNALLGTVTSACEKKY